MRSTTSYIELPLEVPNGQQRNRLRGGSFNLLSFTSFLALLCTATAFCSAILAVILYTRSAPLAPPTIKHGNTPNGFRRPSQYINLDRIKHVHSFPPITNFPDIVLQVDLIDTKRVMREDHRTLHTDTGTIYTDDRHVLITREVSTVIQFRHLDFGMEHCKMITAAPTYHPANKNISGVIDVWLLDTSTEISRQMTHSWTSAPKRHRLLDSLTVNHSMSSVLQFDCHSNEFTTLEFSCQSTSECDVDFWQDKRQHPIRGIYIIQEPGSITRT